MNKPLINRYWAPVDIEVASLPGGEATVAAYVNITTGMVLTATYLEPRPEPDPEVTVVHGRRRERRNRRNRHYHVCMVVGSAADNAGVLVPVDGVDSDAYGAEYMLQTFIRDLPR